MFAEIDYYVHIRIEPGLLLHISTLTIYSIMLDAKLVLNIPRVLCLTRLGKQVPEKILNRVEIETMHKFARTRGMRNSENKYAMQC